MNKNFLFYGIYGNNWKITTYALGEHDWVTSKWENIKPNALHFIKQPPRNCMQNSEAVQAWIQGKMATFRILVLVSKTEITSREFSFSSRSLRIKIINLDLVSMPEIGGDFFSVSSRSLRISVRNSRSRLNVRDWIRETLILVSRMKKWLSLTSDSNL